jgi:lipopolysaccharide transport system ATP-binding protein
MGNIAIHATDLSKRYAITGTRDRHDTLRDQLVDLVSAVFRRDGHRAGTARRTRRWASTPPATQAPSSRRDENGYVWAVRNVSLDVRHGEVVGLIGRNGAGKSTLLKILARITEPTSGRAVLHGRVGSLLEVGTGFDRELSGRENIFLSGAILGMKVAEIRRKFDEIVAFAELERFIDTPVKRYSSGMYTRLAFAVAAHLEPEILLVDEVLAVGDAGFQSKCLGKMDEARRQGRTVLFVTHNMAMIENLCPRTIFLSDGVVVQDGPTARTIGRYLDELRTVSRRPLMERTDRTGLGEISITAIEFLDAQANPIGHATSGQELVARVHYRCNTPETFRNCRVSLSVHKDERPFFLMSTELVDNRRLELHGEGHVDFVVPELPLSAGEYHVHPYVESNKVVQDWVLGAAPLSVIDGDFYGTGRNYPQGWQGKCVLVKYHWRLNGQPELDLSSSRRHAQPFKIVG